MISRRTGLRLIAVLTLLLLLGLYGYGSWNRLLQRYDIRQLSWQGVSLSTAGIGLAQLSLQQHSDAGVAQVELQGLQLHWRQFGLTPPFWQHLELQRLAFAWQPKQRPTPAAASAPVDLRQIAKDLAWLPQSLRIAQLHAELPCASGRCSLLGDLQLESNRQNPLQLDLQLNLQQQTQQLSWQATLRGEPQALDLALNLSIDGQPQLLLHSNLQNGASGPLWRGELSTQPLSEAAALQAWLRQWALAAEVQLPAAPGAAQLSARWQLQLPPAAEGLVPSLEQLRSADGQFAADANLPEPWPIPGIGQAQGSFSVAARAQAGQWFAERLQVDLNLQQLSADWQQQLPEALRADSLQLRIQPSEPLADLPQTLAARSLPLIIELSSAGASDVELRATLALANAPPWAAQLTQARLQASHPTLSLEGWNARKMKLDLRLDGYLDSEQLRIDIGTGSSLQFGELIGPELRLQQLKVSSQGLRLEADYPVGELQRLSVAGPHELSVQRIEQQYLKPQGWHWQGQLAGDLQHLELDGQLSSDAELQLRLQLQRSSAGDIELQAQLPEMFLRAGNPLSKTLAQWPALLELNNGRLSANVKLKQSAGGAPQVDLQLSGKGLSAIYDRTLLKGLDTRLRLSLKRNQLQLDIDELQLAEANPGIALGPLQLNGRYSANLDRPDSGQLQIEQAQTALLGGQVRLAAGQWDLAQRPLLFPLQVRGLQLEQLFIAYPTEGLAGNGTLDGELPLQLGTEGLQIENGQLAARAPGGHLRFQSERIRALGASNPAMQLVTQSLENFQYETLSSRVDYDQHGKLNLDLRLQGRNPAIEQGRPIHFNIKLEEDIPTLLASLQLTDKVNEIITRRVQQRMLERNAAPRKEP